MAQSTEAPWVSGLLVALTGSLIHAGVNVLNKSDSKCGLGVANSIDFIFVICALPQASTAIVVPVTAARQVFRAILGWLILRELPTKKHIMASLVVALGILLAVIAGPHEKHAVEDIHHFVSLIWSFRFGVWSFAVLLVVIICIHVSFFAPSRETAVILPPASRGGFRWLLRMPVGWTAKRGALAACAGISSGLSVCLWEVVLDIFLVNGLAVAMANVRIAVLVAWLTFLHIAATVLFVLALERFDTNIVMPMFTMSAIIVAVISNLALFQGESRSPLTDNILNRLWFFGGLALICTGLVTSAKADTARELDELRQVARDFLRVTNGEILFSESVESDPIGKTRRVEDPLTILINDIESSSHRSPTTDDVDPQMIDDLLKEIEDEALQNLEMNRLPEK
ncbi:MAG: uncharacterized protein KVP18_001046 [Porospora cf. gigantea A]|uniref:uncharacterized protein n=2 Tax=Porospora cf. gigantea A TaxID=2853593 RepID=UPI003559BAD4|nr:MAG: hypothetical protein KVP18_001046 [Porospora cf. gigantea A]